MKDRQTFQSIDKEKTLSFHVYYNTVEPAFVFTSIQQKLNIIKKINFISIYSVFQIIIITVLLVRYHWSYVTPF